MTGSVARKSAGLSERGAAPRLTTAYIVRKIWLPKGLYHALPWFYLIAGVAAVAATLYIGDWFWFLPHSLLASGACLHLALFVFLKRRRGSSATSQQPEA